MRFTCCHKNYLVFHKIFICLLNNTSLRHTDIGEYCSHSWADWFDCTTHYSDKYLKQSIKIMLLLLLLIFLDTNCVSTSIDEDLVNMFITNNCFILPRMLMSFFVNLLFHARFVIFFVIRCIIIKLFISNSSSLLKA